jgi:uncharacterized protein
MDSVSGGAACVVHRAAREVQAGNFEVSGSNFLVGLTDSLRMNNLSKTKLSDLTEPHRPSTNVTFRRVFVGERGIRAGWSILLFATIYWTLNIVVTAVLGHFVSMDATGSIPLSLGLLQESCQVLVVAVATFAMARIENRPLLSYGYLGDHRPARLLTGMLLGFLCLSVLAALLWRAGLLVFDGLALSGLAAWKYALGWGLVFLLVGFFEESLLRGYVQHTLSRGIGFWWAALLLSALFALGHVGNNGESALGILEVGTAGFVGCLSLWYTKSLWWAVGFHAGWDWGQSYFYGTPDSGLVIQNHFLASHALGSPLWSGGTTGPEGSLATLPLFIALGTGMWLWWGGKRNCPVRWTPSQTADDVDHAE